jgi:hypothetical protein
LTSQAIIHTNAGYFRFGYLMVGGFDIAASYGNYFITTTLFGLKLDSAIG